MDDDDDVRLRNNSGGYQGFKSKTSEKVAALLTEDPKTHRLPDKFFSIGKKLFRELGGRPSKKTAKKEMKERPVSRSAFVSKFKLDLILDEIKVRV